MGDKIEVMKPDGENLVVTVRRILDEEGNTMDAAPHARQMLWVELCADKMTDLQQIQISDILRRQEKEEPRDEQ